jgi:hypothetical protein
MTTIDKLIHDSLAARRGVVLPGEGTLEVRRRGAKKISDTRLAPPRNVVVLIPDEKENVRSVVALMVAEGGVTDVEEAVAAYGSWLEGAFRADGSFVIEGVGELQDGVFVTDPGLDAILNPASEEIVTMEREKRAVPVWVWIAGGIVALLALVALAAAILFCWGGVSHVETVETIETVETAPIGDDASQGDASGALSAEALAEAEAARAAAAEAEAAAAARFHVIAGAFRVESNADNFVVRIKREHPELTPIKILHPRTGYHMVSIVQTPTRSAASSRMNMWWDIDLNLWIWEQP